MKIKNLINQTGVRDLATFPTFNRNLQRAFRFMLAHCGYSIPPGRTQCALNLARAEVWLATRDDLEVHEQIDDEQAYCYCGNPKCKYHERSTHTWDTYVVSIVDEHGHVLASLGGIIDPDDEYLRVIRAELAMEVRAVVEVATPDIVVSEN